ncbi:MAG: hypothetical protein AB8B80_14010 [Marinicellaceae bacterium]
MMLFKNKVWAILILLSFISQDLLAGSLKTNNPERKRELVEGFTEQVYNKMVKLQEMVANEMYVEARAGLEQLLKKRLNNMELANVNQYIGWIDSSEGKYIDAANRFQKALDSEALENQAHFGMMLQMAQMYMAGEQLQKALDMLNEYYSVVDEIEDKTFAFEANIHYQMENYEKAIPPMKKAIELSEEPKERWSYLLYGAYKQSSKFREAVDVLETLIKINPSKKDYWNMLSADYFNLKEDQKALAVLALAEESGLVDSEKELLRLWQMYSFLEIPYSAGKVLQKGLKDGVIKPTFKRWEDLGKTWFAAAEMDSALEAYGEASKLATDGKIDLYRAYIYLDKEDWPKIISTINAAIEKGGLDDNQYGKAWMLIGTAENELKKYNNAIAAFKKAATYPNTKSGANQWLNHLEARARQERERAEIERANARERAANAIIE